MLYPINTLQKSNRTRSDQVKSKVVVSVFPLSIKIKRKFTFFTANTKYISSCALKISAFSLVLRTREKYWFFHHTRWNIFGIHLKKVNILYVFESFLELLSAGTYLWYTLTWYNTSDFNVLVSLWSSVSITKDCLFANLEYGFPHGGACIIKTKIKQ